ncbi:Uncharacterized protein dnm_095280 [Desulfonema magnum]|uniref:Uncharacterized protein n=1 Tax=Desulfonema magnum TaxID=45655 RepID=A0A975BY09_9BACT|nr:Uncharacterized protein dnm_095280 [Desulfonema magnum]
MVVNRLPDEIRFFRIIRRLVNGNHLPLTAAIQKLKHIVSDQISAEG